jgi:hypothetical protein
MIPMPASSSGFSVFFSGYFEVSDLTLRSSIHFELIFVQVERDLVSVFCGYPVFSTTLLKTPPFHQCTFLVPLLEIRWL